MPEAATQRQSISVQEFAAAHGIHEQTVRRLIAAGDIDAFYIGKSLRIPIDALATGRRTDTAVGA
jgi:excisionase family DNA binding protein